MLGRSPRRLQRARPLLISVCAGYALADWSDGAARGAGGAGDAQPPGAGRRRRQRPVCAANRSELRSARAEQVLSAVGRGGVGAHRGCPGCGHRALRQRAGLLLPAGRVMAEAATRPRARHRAQLAAPTLYGAGQLAARTAGPQAPTWRAARRGHLQGRHHGGCAGGIRCRAASVATVPLHGGRCAPRARAGRTVRRAAGS